MQIRAGCRIRISRLNTWQNGFCFRPRESNTWFSGQMPILALLVSLPLPSQDRREAHNHPILINEHSWDDFSLSMNRFIELYDTRSLTHTRLGKDKQMYGTVL